jgi:hypothetical protein
LTASGSLLDCIAQRKPLIAVQPPPLAAIAERYGPIGYLRADISAAGALLADASILRDPVAYTRFQRSFEAVQRDRRPDAIAKIIRQDLGC